MHIVLVQETNWISRNVIHQHHLAERLVKRGHKVDVIDYDILWPEDDSKAIWTKRMVFPGINKVTPGGSLDVTRPAVVNLPLLSHLSWTISSLHEVRRFVQQDCPDVIIALTLSNSYFLSLYAKSISIPLVYIELEPYHAMVSYRVARFPAKIVERLALQNVDRVLVFTPQMQEYVKNMGTKVNRISRLKTGVSLDIFHPGLDGSGLRKKMGISNEEWVLFFMGWLYDFSGLREIIQAIANDPDIMNRARLLIVGDGDLYEELKLMVKSCDIENLVILAGRHQYSEIPELLSIADICLMPSIDNNVTREIVPMKIYEYLAAGKPVAASRLQGMVTEFGSKEDRGIIYGNNPLEVFGKALALRSTPEMVKMLSEAGRKTAEENADWEITTDEFEQLLLELISQGGK